MRFTKGVAVLAMMGTALIAGAQSTWTFNSLHDFDRTSARAEGGVILAPDGNYYGTFSQGGANGNGGIFKVAIDPATGNSSYSVVYSFSALAGNGANADGAASAQSPAGSLALSADFTQLYGTTTAGGAFGLGTLFSLTLPTLANPSPSFGTLASFGASSAAQGFVTAQPALQIVVGPDGTVYGTSPGGEIWKYDGSPSVLYTLSMGTGPRVNHDGELPQGLVYGPDGKLWGVCASGGANASGTVFNLTTTGQFSLVYTYSSGPYQSNQTNSDGANPIGLSALPDGSGFYVVTTQGGANGSGAIGKATVAGVFTALGSFPAAGDAGGSTPTAAPLVASDGTILQTFSAGGANGTGAVSTVTLPPVAAAVAFPAGAGTLATVTLSPVFTFLALSSDGSNSSGAIPVGPTMAVSGPDPAGTDPPPATIAVVTGDGGIDSVGNIMQAVSAEFPLPLRVHFTEHPFNEPSGNSLMLNWVSQGASKCHIYVVLAPPNQVIDEDVPLNGPQTFSINNQPKAGANITCEDAQQHKGFDFVEVDFSGSSSGGSSSSGASSSGGSSSGSSSSGSSSGSSSSGGASSSGSGSSGSSGGSSGASSSGGGSSSGGASSSGAGSSGSSSSGSSSGGTSSSSGGSTVSIDTDAGLVNVSTSAGQFTQGGVAVTPTNAFAGLGPDEKIPFGFVGFSISGAPPSSQVTITISVPNLPGMILTGYEKCLGTFGCSVLNKPGASIGNVALKDITPGFGTTRLILTCTTDDKGNCDDPGAPVEQSSGGSGGGAFGWPLLLSFGLIAGKRRRSRA